MSGHRSLGRKHSGRDNIILGIIYSAIKQGRHSSPLFVTLAEVLMALSSTQLANLHTLETSMKEVQKND